jgi:hypothetical protein
VLRHFEIILTTVCIILSTVFLTLIILRVRGLLLKRSRRVYIWNSSVGKVYMAAKIILALSLLLLAPGIIYFIFIATMPSAVIRIYAKTLFCMTFSVWAFLEIILCFSISVKLLEGSIYRRIAFFGTILICAVGALYFFPLIPRSLPYPAVSECVVLDLPVKGTWLAGQAGATEITNGHLTNRYAIDILKLGDDGRMYKGDEKDVTDFYSYDEPVYAPADGRVTEVVDGLESDIMGNQDEENPGGNRIILDIGNEKYAYFGHFKKGSIAVEEGQFVSAGELLARIGNSGYSTHPHLHMHIQNKPSSDPEGRLTYPFRFSNMRRKRLIFWREINNAALLRNDLFSDKI